MNRGLDKEVLTAESYSEKSKKLLVERQENLAKRKEFVTRLSEEMGIKHHVTLINVILEGHAGAEYIYVLYEIPNVDAAVWDAIAKEFRATGHWHVTHLKRDGISISSHSLLPEEYHGPDGYRGHPYLRYSGDLTRAVVDFWYPETCHNWIPEHLMAFGEYITVELKGLMIPLTDFCRPNGGKRGKRMKECSPVWI